MKKTADLLIVAAFLRLFCATNSLAQEVSNGSFEETFSVPPYYRYIPNDALIPFWSLTGSGIGEQSYLYDFGSPGSPYNSGDLTLDGIHALRLSWGDAISQSISNFIPGRAYRFTFFLAGSPGAGQTIVSAGSVTQTFVGVSMESLDFVATNSTLTISIAAYSPANDSAPSGIILDNVQVGSFAVPPTLSISRFPGIDITGTRGGQYQLQGSSALTTTNWAPLTNFVIPASPFRCYQITTANQSNKFFRAVVLP